MLRLIHLISEVPLHPNILLYIKIGQLQELPRRGGLPQEYLDYHKKHPPRRTLRRLLGGGAVSYERGTPVTPANRPHTCQRVVRSLVAGLWEEYSTPLKDPRPPGTGIR